MAIQASRPKYLVSACLAGINCTHKGANHLKKSIKKLVDDKKAVSACPEVLGGLGIPRDRSEIIGGDGMDALFKIAKVMTESGRDVSPEFIRGAEKILRLVRKHGIKKAILKSKSPACGLNVIYDGTFKGALRRGDGVLAAILKLNGIKVYTENTAKHLKSQS